MEGFFSNRNANWSNVKYTPGTKRDWFFFRIATIGGEEKKSQIKLE